MQQQIIQSNLEPVPQESRPPKTGEDVELFKTAIEGNRVATSEEEELKTVIRYCMVLVGLKACNFPQDEERDMLLNFIVNNYGKHSLAEIRLAFDMAVAGKLGLKPEDVKCYENFSILYFSSIMNCYRRWAVNFHEENRLYGDKPKLTALPPGPTDWKELCELRYQDYLSGKYNMDLWPAELYDEFVKVGWMEEKVYEDFFIDAAKSIRHKLLEEKQAAKLAGNLKELSTLDNLLSKVGTQDEQANINIQAKRLAVQYLYKCAKDKGYKNLFTKV